MKVRIKNLGAGLALVSALAVIIFSLFIGVSIVGDTVTGVNVSNQTVLARVNVSNTEPNLNDVQIRVNGTGAPPIDLIAGSVTVVICNGSFSDVNGFEDIKNVTATFFHNSSSSVAADDNNNHYSNISCGNCSATPNTNNVNGSCICQFPVQYYADPGLWQCNMTINDSYGIASTKNSSFVNVNELLAIDIEDAVMDYGNLSVTQTSEYIRENVTNTGNIPLNITVYGYGGTNYSTGMNVTMVCGSGTNISFGNQRYYPGNNSAFGQMYNLTNQSRQITNLTIPQRTDDVSLGNSSNSTYWKLSIPLGAAGICNGTIIFGGVDTLNN